MPKDMREPYKPYDHSRDKKNPYKSPEDVQRDRNRGRINPKDLDSDKPYDNPHMSKMGKYASMHEGHKHGKEADRNKNGKD